MEKAREGGGPTFLHAHCIHLEGHFLGDSLFRSARHLVKEGGPMIGPVFKSVAKRKGASLRERIDSLGDVLFRGRGAVSDQTSEEKHPVIKARKGLETNPDRLEALESSVAETVRETIKAVMEE